MYEKIALPEQDFAPMNTLTDAIMINLEQTGFLHDLAKLIPKPRDVEKAAKELEKGVKNIIKVINKK
jgi:hypothetical protein